jgi:uncharacterized membrane protein
VRNWAILVAENASILPQVSGVVDFLFAAPIRARCLAGLADVSGGIKVSFSIFNCLQTRLVF